MAVRARQVHVIRTVEELKALRSPTRFRLLNLLRKIGEASASILADRMGMKAESLYYHIHVLEKADLVTAVRERETGRRPEVIYAPRAPNFEIDRRQRDPDFLEALLSIYRSQMRFAERCIEDALMAEVDGTGPRTRTNVRQYEVSLHPFKADRMRRLIGTLDDFLVEADDPKGQETYHLTIAWSKED